ncbi:MAG: hypothetical protein JWO05_3026 [Gemmatimonadetes bacterium]|nr:hypothetical protein [Gemmatimonadota bacterium]
MTIPDLRARSVSEIVDGAFSLYRRDALTYILATSVGYIPLLAFQLLVRSTTTVTGFGGGALGAVLGIVGFVCFMTLNAVVIRYSSDVYMQQQTDFSTALGETVPHFVALVVAGIIRTFCFAIGALFFLVGAFYFAARLFATNPAIVLEGRGPIDALNRSSDLSVGNKRHILNTLILMFVIYFLGSMAVTAISAMFGNLTIQIILSAVYTVIAYPVIGITEMLLYYDARIRREGFDVEVMAGALEPTPAV